MEKSNLKKFLCKEGFETFIIQAINLQDAMRKCEIWNAIVLYEIKD